MKIYSDLEFKPHHQIPGARHAKMEFDNGMWISVIGTSGAKIFDKEVYEVYSPITKKKIVPIKTNQTPSQVSAHMRYLQKL